MIGEIRRRTSILALVSASILLAGLVSVPTASAQKDNPSSSLSWSPRVKNDFTWRADSFVQRKAPPENYMETENLLVKPNYKTLANVLLENVEIYDNSGKNKVLIDTIPAYQVVKENENFVKYRPPGRNVYLFTIENVRINGKKPPFYTKKKLDNPTVSLDVRLSDFGRGLIRAINHPTNFLPYLDDYYLKGFDSVSLANLKELYSELDNLPVYQGGSLKKKVSNFDLSLNDRATRFKFGVDLKNRNPSFAYASGKLGSHSISWSVSSSTDWWSASETAPENDVRTTISDGSLELTGENLVGYWSMDEFPSGFGSTDNTVYDLTSHINDGTAVNGPAITAGKFDNALDFDNTKSQYIDIPSSLGPGGSYTIMAWIKPDALGYQGYFWDLRYNYETYLTTDSSGCIELNHNDTSTEIQIIYDSASTGTWYHCVGVWDSANDNLKFYVNGSRIGSKTVTDMRQLGYQNAIGSVYDGSDYYVDGIIDEVYFFPQVALSDNQIRRIYNRTKPSEMTDGDLKTGTWASSVWDSGGFGPVDNLEFSSTIGTNENIWGNIGSDTDNDGTVEDNTGWVQLDGKGGVWSNPAVDNGYRFQVMYRLETDNTTHSPSVQDYTLNHSGYPPSLSSNKAENVNAYSGDFVGELMDTYGWKDNIWVSYREEGTTAWENTSMVQENVADNYAFGISGLKDNTTYEWRFAGCLAENQKRDNLGSIKTFTTDYPRVSFESKSEVSTSGFKVTASIENRGEPSLDVILQYREKGTTSWSEKTITTAAGTKDYSTAVDGLKSDTDYEVRWKIVGSTYYSDTWVIATKASGGGAPIAPVGPQPMTIDVEVGRLEEGTFAKVKELGLGDVATVKIEVTSNGEPVEGADVGAWWIPRPTIGKTESIGISEVGGGAYQGSFTIPENVAPGTYEVSVEAAKSGYEKAYGYDTFRIVPEVAKPGPLDKAVAWARENLTAVAVLIAAIFLFALIARW